MSLCYQPAAKRLSVVVLKARNVPKMDITGFSGDSKFALLEKRIIHLVVVLQIPM